MALHDATKAIADRAAALWPTIEPTVPLAKEFENFPRPYSSTHAPTEFILLRIEPTEGDFASIGAPDNLLVRQLGLIWFYAFVEIGTGLQRMVELCDEFATIFVAQTFDGVVCGAKKFAGNAEREDGAYSGITAYVPFYYDEVI